MDSPYCKDRIMQRQCIYCKKKFKSKHFQKLYCSGKCRAISNYYKQAPHRRNSWMRQRWKCLQRDKFTCQYCGRKAPEVKLEADHKIPKSKGGSDELENLITACNECNRGKIADVIV